MQFTPEEHKRLVDFFSLLIQIDRRLSRERVQKQNLVSRMISILRQRLQTIG